MVPSLRPRTLQTLLLAVALLALSCLSSLPAAASPTTGSYPVSVVSTQGSLAWSDPSCGDGAFHSLTATAVVEGSKLVLLELHADPVPGLHASELHLSISGGAGGFVARGPQRYAVDDPTGSTEANLNCVALGAVEVVSATLACGDGLRVTLAAVSTVAGAQALPSVSRMSYASSAGVACVAGYSYELAAGPGGTPVFGGACLRNASFSIDLDNDGMRDFYEPNLKTVTLGAC